MPARQVELIRDLAQLVKTRVIGPRVPSKPQVVSRKKKTTSIQSG